MIVQQQLVQIDFEQQQVHLQSQETFFSEECFVQSVVRLDCCIQDGRCSELNITWLRAAGSLLQLQNCHIVGSCCAEDVGRDEKCHLRASSRPVTSHIEAVNPNLSLGEKEKEKVGWIISSTFLSGLYIHFTNDITSWSCNYCDYAICCAYMGDNSIKWKIPKN